MWLSPRICPRAAARQTDPERHIPGMDRDDDILWLRDELTRRFDLVLRPSVGEIELFREEASRMGALLGDREAAERAAARQVFLMQSERPPERLAPEMRSAA